MVSILILKLIQNWCSKFIDQFQVHWSNKIVMWGFPSFSPFSIGISNNLIYFWILFRFHFVYTIYFFYLNQIEVFCKVLYHIHVHNVVQIKCLMVNSLYLKKYMKMLYVEEITSIAKTVTKCLYMYVNCIRRVLIQHNCFIKYILTYPHWYIFKCLKSIHSLGKSIASSKNALKWI